MPASPAPCPGLGGWLTEGPARPARAWSHEVGPALPQRKSLDVLAWVRARVARSQPAAARPRWWHRLAQCGALTFLVLFFFFLCLLCPHPDCRCRVDTTCLAAWIPAPQNVSPRWVNIVFFFPGLACAVSCACPSAPVPVAWLAEDPGWALVPGQAVRPLPPRPCPCRSPSHLPVQTAGVPSREEGCPGEDARASPEPGACAAVGATSDFPRAHFPVCPKGPSSAQAASGCEATGSWQAQAGAVGAQPGGGLCGDAPGAEARREGHQSCALQRAGVPSTAWGRGRPGEEQHPRQAHPGCSRSHGHR